MHYSPETIKYCLLTWDHAQTKHIQSYTSQPLTISGLYLWASAFTGQRTFPRTPEEMEQFNIVHCNLTPKNLPLLPIVNRLRDCNKTKLLVNVDFAIEMWFPNLRWPDYMLSEIDQCDYVFSVEERQAEVLELLLKRPVPVIPHPVDTAGLRPLRVKERTQRIVVSGHRYDRNYLLPSIACRAALPPGWITGLVHSETQQVAETNHLFDENQPPLPFKEAMQYTAESYAALETYTIHSYGRYSAECAALGVPCVGPNVVGSINRCFPDLATEHNDVKTQSELIRRLIHEPEFHAHCGIQGLERVEYYSLRNSRDRMIAFLNGQEASNE